MRNNIPQYEKSNAHARANMVDPLSLMTNFSLSMDAAARIKR
jgi:hypothetical protein